MASFMGPIRSLFKRRELLWQFLLRNVKVRHRGSGGSLVDFEPVAHRSLRLCLRGGFRGDSPIAKRIHFSFALGIFRLNVLGLVSGIIGVLGLIVGQPNFVKKLFSS